MSQAAPAERLDLSAGRSLSLEPGPRIMGVVNVTPDSFSDGGLYLEPERAVDRALEMVAEGADMLDLGAASSRPGGGVYGAGAQPVTAAEECERLLPVLERLRSQVEIPISVDTRLGSVARAALDAGADLINDTSALADPALAAAVAEHRCPVVLMHSRGELASMQSQIRFADLLQEVCDELAERLAVATAAGIERRQVILDPGIGFGKTYAQNLALLRYLPRVAELGQPLLVGASRKSFIGHLTGTPVDDRLAGSLAAAAWAAIHEVALLRVHDVAATRQFLTVFAAVRNVDANGSPAPETE